VATRAGDGKPAEKPADKPAGAKPAEPKADEGKGD
jgi:hypothetical protein